VVIKKKIGAIQLDESFQLCRALQGRLRRNVVRIEFDSWLSSITWYSPDNNDLSTEAGDSSLLRSVARKRLAKADWDDWAYSELWCVEIDDSVVISCSSELSIVTPLNLDNTTIRRVVVSTLKRSLNSRRKYNSKRKEFSCLINYTPRKMKECRYRATQPRTRWKLVPSIRQPASFNWRKGPKNPIR
jgi:hypothetical protein